MGSLKGALGAGVSGAIGLNNAPPDALQAHQNAFYNNAIGTIVQRSGSNNINVNPRIIDIRNSYMRGELTDLEAELYIPELRRLGLL